MEPSSSGYSRRKVLDRAIAVAGGLMLAGAGRTIAGPSPEDLLAGSTALQVAGPFYPIVKPLDQDSDLTTVAGGGRALGQVLEIAGRVVNLQGEPVAGARMELWQANASGRYAHESDPNTAAPLDPNFQGYAVLETDELGRYRFKTIKPGPYPVPRFVNSTGMRPPHIHFEITGRRDRLTTQLYFPGDALNETDSLLRSAADQQATLFARAVPAAPDMDGETQLMLWNVVLPTG